MEISSKMLPGAICRTCLTTNGVMFNLFGPNSIQLDPGKETVADFVGLLTRSMLEEDDGLPIQICQTCYFEIQRAYILKTKCERSLAVLTQLRNVKIKIRKLKSDSSPDTSRKKPMLFMNGLAHSKVSDLSDKVIISVTSSEADTMEFDALNIFNKKNTSCTTKYVEFLDDPLNLIEFDQLGGSQPMAINDIDLDGVVIKQEVDSDAASTMDDETLIKFGENLMKPTAAENETSVNNTTTNSTAEEQNFECPACPYVHISSEGLEKHMIKNHMNENMCSICSQDISGNEKEHFARHIGPHVDYDEIIEGTTLIGGDYQCSFCPEYFKLRVGLESHIESVHPSNNPPVNTVEAPTATTTAEGNLLSKIEDIFNEFIEETMDDYPAKTPAATIPAKIEAETPIVSRSVRCDVCEKSFVNEEELDLHVSIMHAVKNANGEVVFKCPQCPQTYADKAVFIDHIKLHETGKPYRCEICQQTFRFKRNLDCHMRFKHCPECKGVKTANCNTCYVKLGPRYRSKQCPECKGAKNINCATCATKAGQKQQFECELCFKVFPNRSTLHRHKRMHLQDKPFKCELCSQSFNYKQILNLHVKEKHGPDAVRVESEYKCKSCSMVFTRRLELIMHMKTHDTTKIHTCQYCPQSFELYSLLVRHMEEHMNADGFHCIECAEKFTTEANFKAHIAEKHAEVKHVEVMHAEVKHAEVRHAEVKPEESFHCVECNLEFTEKSLLDEHARSHTNDKPFECEICKQSFRYSQSLARHMKTYHTKQLQMYQCQLCPQTFQDRSELVNHFRSHTVEKTFECEVCAEKFPDKLRLGAHMVLKHDAKSVQKQYFKCETCSKTFWNKGLYESHMETHATENTYSCEMCSQVFLSGQLLKQHFEKMHQGEITEMLPQFTQSCDLTNDTILLINNTNIVYENSTSDNNFVFSDAFLNSDQMIGIQGAESMINDLFDESSIEVA